MREHLIQHLIHFFDTPPAGVQMVTGRYEPSLVVLSVLVAIALSLLSLRMARSAQLTIKGTYKNLTVLTGAVALGSGIWTMHFIGMFAFRLPAPVHFDFTLTFLSMLPALGAAWATLRLLTQPVVAKKQLVIGGVLMGAGIGTMHYGGMLSIVTPLTMTHDPIWFGISIVVAVTLAMLAIWINFGLESTKLSRSGRFWLAGITMGMAIAEMHYTAMMAVHFYGEPIATNNSLEIHVDYIALAIASITVTIAMAVAALNGLVHSRELNKEILTGQRRMKAIFDTAVDAIIMINKVGIVQDYNQSAERMFGFTYKEVVGQNIKMLMPEPYKSEHDGYLKRYNETKVRRVIGIGREVVGQRKDGSVFPMRLAVGQVARIDEEDLFVGMVTDLTDRKKLEESLRQEAIKAEQAAQAKGDFLANMSHEIRTPMNAIIGFTDIVLDTELQPKQRAHMNTIRQSARSLLGLLNDILDSSKFESGKVILEKVDFNIQIITEQVVETLSVNAQKRGLTLNTQYAQSMPLYYKGDPLRLSQILTNLIGNAIKFTERGGINLVVSYDNNELHLQIQDTGIGMTPEQTAKVFEAFTQADASINRRFGGTGLGTTISRQIVEAMNGRIDVESQLGTGTIFHVYLPLELGVYVPEQQKSRVMVLPELNILIADDIEQNLELLALVLERKGHKVVAANNGLEAFALFKEQTFDVILMDVNMPEVDGLQSTRLIRAYEQEHGLKATPIVALTASVLASDRQLTEQAGMNGFAVKPLDPPALFEEIARILNIEPQFEAAAVQAVAPTVAHSDAIDWEHGLSLWGSKAKLIPKIVSFIETIEQENWDEKDNEQLAFTLHSIKGVAGNLGLMSLSHWAGVNETKARQGDILDVHNLAMLAHNFIIEIKLLLAKEASSATPDKEAAAKQQRADLPELLSKLKEKLDTCELDDALLEQILPYLEPADGQHLQSALDAFDFEQASALVSHWL